MLEQEIERYLCLLVYEDLSAVDRIKIEMKIRLLRSLNMSSKVASINA